MYLWNGFEILAKNERLLVPIFQEIDRKLHELSTMSQTSENPQYLVGMLLKAMCLKHLQSPFQAEQILLEIINKYF